jgi:hypothetical protein
MNPVECTLHTNVPSLLIDIVSFESPTVPRQLPMIFVEYSASGTGVKLFVQAPKKNPKTINMIDLVQYVQLVFMK